MTQKEIGDPDFAMNRISFSEVIPLLLVFLVGGGMSGLFGFVLDLALADGGFSSVTILFFSHFLTGLIACAFYWSIRMRRVERQHVADDRTIKLGLMRHFIGKSLAAVEAQI